jgi:arylsulfatase A-like enzyme
LLCGADTVNIFARLPRSVFAGVLSMSLPPALQEHFEVEASMNNSNREMARALIAPVLGAGIGALLWACYETLSLIQGGVGVLGASKAAAAAGALATLMCLPAAIFVAWVWNEPRLGGRLRSLMAGDPERSAALVVTSVAGLFVLSATTLGAMVFFEGIFASDDVNKIALLATVPVVALGLAVACRAAWPRLERWLRTAGRATAVVAAVLAVLVVGAIWIAFIHGYFSSVFNQLAAGQYLSFVAALMAGVIAALLGGRPWLLRAGLAANIVLVGLAVWYGLGEPPKKLKLVLEQEGSGSGYVLDLISDDHEPLITGGATPGESAVCKPGQRRPKASDVGKAEDQAPDVIWFTVDSLRWDHLKMSGYSRKTMPQLEKHAGKAAVFEQAYATASSTRQTFRSVFSGIYSSRVEAPKSTKWGVSFSDEQETVASYMSAAGYQSIALSSDPGAFPKKYGAFRGFEVVDESATPIQKTKKYTAPYKVDRTIAYLSNPKEDRPKFIWTHLIEPHQPYQSGPEPKKWKGRKERDRYDSSLRFVDGELDRLLDFARGPDRRRRTIVVITGDHGQAFREHGNRFHGKTVYQEETHVPLFVWGPGVEAGRYKTPVSLIDLLPTTLDLVGLKIPEALCGVSLGPTLLEGAEPPQRPVYVEIIPDRTWDYFAVALIRGDDKVIIQPTTGTTEMFNLSKDPDEKNDIADEQPERLREHLRVFREFYREHGLDPAEYGLGRPK